MYIMSDCMWTDDCMWMKMSNRYNNSMFGMWGTHHLLCFDSIIVCWSKMCSFLSVICSLLLWLDIFKVFLTLFGESELDEGHEGVRGNRNNARQQAAHMKEKDREMGCKLDWWSISRVWLLETQHQAYLPVLTLWITAYIYILYLQCHHRVRVSVSVSMWIWGHCVCLLKCNVLCSRTWFPLNY